MQISRKQVRTQHAWLGTNVIQVNVSIDATQWDTGYVLLGSGMGGVSYSVGGRLGGAQGGS